MILSLGFRFDASKMCDWCHGTCNTVTCYNHHYELFWMFSDNSLDETTVCGMHHDSSKTMTWTQARQWCQARFTDMMLKPRGGWLSGLYPAAKDIFSLYFWIPLPKKHKSEIWTQFENNSIRIGNDSSATNEPNSRSVFCFFCKLTQDETEENGMMGNAAI